MYMYSCKRHTIYASPPSCENFPSPFCSVPPKLNYHARKRWGTVGRKVSGHPTWVQKKSYVKRAWLVPVCENYERDRGGGVCLAAGRLECEKALPQGKRRWRRHCRCHAMPAAAATLSRKISRWLFARSLEMGKCTRTKVPSECSRTVFGKPKLVISGDAGL